MKRLIEEFDGRRSRYFVRSPITWVFLCGIGLIVAGIVSGSMAIQRRDYQRAVDAAMARSLEATTKAVEQIRKDVQALKIRNEDALKTAGRIEKSVQAVKEIVQP